MKRMLAMLGLLCAAPAMAAKVPFVGCPLDGQLGPQRAPLVGASPDVPAAAAAKLAFYAAADLPGVLAPRGWRCAATAGSNGSTLVVTPGDPAGARLTDDAVVLTLRSGSTSGRLEVAEVAARLFPEAAPWVARVEAEGQKFVHAPYAGDRIVHRGPWQALVTTPAGRTGSAVTPPLVPAGKPVDGAFLLDPGGDHDLVAVTARLPAAARPLLAAIIAEVSARR